MTVEQKEEDVQMAKLGPVPPDPYEGLLKRPESYEHIGTVMSNFDHEIDEEIGQQVKEGTYYASYAAWNFKGEVWFDGESGQFACEVWRHHVHIDTILAEDLEALMSAVSDKYGSE